MERTKKFILKKYKRYFYSLKFVKKCRQKELKAFTLIEINEIKTRN